MSVPCNGCTICCHNDALRLLPGDDASLYETEPHCAFPGELMLAHDKNHDCVYLTSEGCGIYESRPIMCREKDCRGIAKKLSKKQAVKMRILPVWNRGRQLSGRPW